LLFHLSRLVDHLDVVAIRVEHPGCETIVCGCHPRSPAEAVRARKAKVQKLNVVVRLMQPCAVPLCCDGLVDLMEPMQFAAQREQLTAQVLDLAGKFSEILL
jgi:hypothetical protein